MSLIALWRAGAHDGASGDRRQRQEAIEARFAMLARSSASLAGESAACRSGSGRGERPCSGRRRPARLAGARLGQGSTPNATTGKVLAGSTASRGDRRGAIAHERMTRGVVSLRTFSPTAVARPSVRGGWRRSCAIACPPAPTSSSSPSPTDPAPIASSACPATPGARRRRQFPLEGFTACARADEEARRSACAGAHRRRQARQGHRRALSVPANAGRRADVCVPRKRSIPISSTSSTNWCRRLTGRASSSSRRP